MTLGLWLPAPKLPSSLSAGSLLRSAATGGNEGASERKQGAECCPNVNCSESGTNSCAACSSSEDEDDSGSDGSSDEDENDA